MHQIALSGLDVDVPFIRVWGEHYRRVHRIERTYGSLSGPVAVERTLYRELGQRQGPVLDPIAARAGVVDGSWLPLSRDRCASGCKKLTASPQRAYQSLSVELAMSAPCRASCFPMRSIGTASMILETTRCAYMLEETLLPSISLGVPCALTTPSHLLQAYLEKQLFSEVELGWLVHEMSLGLRANLGLDALAARTNAVLLLQADLRTTHKLRGVDQHMRAGEPAKQL